MERETRTVALSNCEVDIITHLTWGEKEKMQAQMMSGAKVDNTGITDFDFTKLLEGKYALMETAIKEIRTQGKSEQFTREWVDNLSVEDGDLLYGELEALNEKKA